MEEKNGSGDELLQLFIELCESYRHIVAMIGLYGLAKQVSEDAADEIFDKILAYVIETNEKVERLANTAVANYELRCEL